MTVVLNMHKTSFIFM